MNDVEKEKRKQRRLKGDFYLWATVIFLLIVGVVSHQYFKGVALAIRISGWILLLLVEVFIVLRTATGQKFWQFIKNARIELLKVVWPSRQETVQVTMLVVVLVVMTALFLWGIDSILLWALSHWAR